MGPHVCALCRAAQGLLRPFAKRPGHGGREGSYDVCRRSEWAPPISDGDAGTGPTRPGSDDSTRGASAGPEVNIQNLPHVNLVVEKDGGSNTKHKERTHPS